MEYDTNLSKVLLKNLYDNRNQLLCCDILLITRDNERIPAHKIVLMSSASPYLQSLIRCNSEMSELDLDISSSQMEIIIRYLYTAKVSVTEVSEIKDLYESADLLVIHFLRNYSTNKLINTINMEFCLEYLRHSLKYSIKILEEKCLNFIAENTEMFFDKFLKELSLNEFEKLMEIREIFNITEIELFHIIKKWILFNYDMRKYYIEKFLLNIDFLKIPSNIFHDEIETDLELRTNVNFMEKIIAIKEFKEKKKSILYANCSGTGQESLYYITVEAGIEIKKINIKKDHSERSMFVRGKYNKNDCGICNFKYGNRDFILFSGGFEKYPYLTNTNLIWSPNEEFEIDRNFNLPSLLQNRAKHRSIFFDGKIYVCGGYTSGENLLKKISTKSSELFDFEQEKWYKGPEFVNSKEWNIYGLTYLDQCLYAFGRGYVENMDPRINKWNLITSSYNDIIAEAFPCSETSILCIGEGNMGRSLIFDIRNQKFTKDRQYDCIENFKLLDVVKLNDEIYGAYKKKDSKDCYIRKIDKKNPYDWNILENDFKRRSFKLLTIRD